LHGYDCALSRFMASAMRRRITTERVSMSAACLVSQAI
jgi:hypothetical protein